MSSAWTTMSAFDYICSRNDSSYEDEFQGLSSRCRRGRIVRYQSAVRIAALRYGHGCGFYAAVPLSAGIAYAVGARSARRRLAERASRPAARACRHGASGVVIVADAVREFPLHGCRHSLYDAVRLSRYGRGDNGAALRRANIAALGAVSGCLRGRHSAALPTAFR